jgi:hypothetical protein
VGKEVRLEVGRVGKGGIGLRLGKRGMAQAGKGNRVIGGVKAEERENGQGCEVNNVGLRVGNVVGKG